MKKITLIDYDMGNIFNVIRAFESLDCEVELTKDPEKIVKAERLVLPGVGAFEDGISNLKKLNLDKAISEFIKTTRPILGICIGMQLMMTKSEENGLHAGLNLIKGDVVRFDENNSGKNGYKIPQIGWNFLIEKKNFSVSKSQKNILKGLSKSPSMYFLHSYFVRPKDENIAITETHYGKNTFCSAFKKENVIGFQFHPERSGKDGLLLLKNFLEI